MGNPFAMKLEGPMEMSRGAATTDPPTTGLLARYRADSEVTGTTNVSAWGDMTANAFDLAQGTGGNQPELVSSVINGQPVIRFTRANQDHLFRNTTPAETQPYTWVVIAARTTGSQEQWFVSATNGFRSLGLDSDNTVKIFAGDTLDSGDAVGDANFHLYEALFNSTTSEIWLDGVSVGTGNANTGAIAGILVGAGGIGSGHLDGDIAEIFLYDHALDSTERSTMDAYVAARYGI